MSTRLHQMNLKARGVNWHHVRERNMVLGPTNKLISTAGKGHIRVEKPTAWMLSGGFPLESQAESEAEEYTISLFHQLHCLVSVHLAILNIIYIY